MQNDNWNQTICELKKRAFGKEYTSGELLLEAKMNLKKLHIIKALKKIILAVRICDKKTVYDFENENTNLKSVNSISAKKICIYTCITGKYDSIKEPLWTSKNVDYICFSNCVTHSDIWKIRSIPHELKKFNNLYINRYLKMHPFEYLDGYDAYIYIDGNTVVMADISKVLNNINSEYNIGMHKHSMRDCIYEEYKACIKLKKGNKKNIMQQIKAYEKVGFPKKYGLLEATVIVSIPSNSSKKIFDLWWNEFEKSKSDRDQISLPYILWKNNICVNDIGTLGNNVYMNECFLIRKHF